MVDHLYIQYVIEGLHTVPSNIRLSWIPLKGLCGHVLDQKLGHPAAVTAHITGDVPAILFCYAISHLWE